MPHIGATQTASVVLIARLAALYQILAAAVAVMVLANGAVLDCVGSVSVLIHKTAESFYEESVQLVDTTGCASGIAVTLSGMAVVVVIVGHGVDKVARGAPPQCEQQHDDSQHDLHGQG